ncbi:hypothetical protein P4S72_24160 [Vibrio sp. PP-XX7]
MSTDLKPGADTQTIVFEDSEKEKTARNRAQLRCGETTLIAEPAKRRSRQF